MEKAKSYEIDMCHGPLFRKILLFTLPLMLSGILQLLFNAADVIVVGQFAGNEALAAVGSTSALTNLLVNLFIGLSVGVNVLVARFYGAQQEQEAQETVHTAIVVSVLGGILLAFIGIVLAKPLLQWMDTPDDVINHSVLYMRIYFAGMPVMLLYNFGSAVLRAIGDTRRPLYFLAAAGVINVILNLIFVINFHMGVAGVALATIISQCVSALLILRCLMNSEGCIRVEWSKLHIHWGKLGKIAQIGLPAGVQGVLFSISNVLIQSSVNSFGSVAMAGNTAAQNVEGFVYTSMNSVHQTAVSFTSQNLGGRQYGRINKILLECILFVTAVGLILGNGAYLFGHQILGIYSSDPQVIDCGADVHHLYNVLPVWNHGCSGWLHPGTWLCGYADDRFSDGSLCFPRGLYLYHIPVEQDITDVIYFLSNFLGADGGSSCDLFCDCAKEDWSAEIMAAQEHWQKAIR